MSTDLSPQMTAVVNALHEARHTHSKNAAALTDIEHALTRCKQQKAETESESRQAEGQWRTLFRQLRGEMTPALQAQHHERISKRELAKEFDGLIEEMTLDKMGLHLDCVNSGLTLEKAHQTALQAFTDEALATAIQAIDAAIVQAWVTVRRAYDTYQEAPQAVLEQRLMQALQARITQCAKALDDTALLDGAPVLKDIGLARPATPGVLDRLRSGPLARRRYAEELQAKRAQLAGKQED